MKTLQKKAQAIVKLRDDIEGTKVILENLKGKRDTLQTELIQDLKKNELNSIKTADGVMISKVIQKTLGITDENALINDLKKKGLGQYVRENVDRGLWRTFSTQAIKENLKLPGTELRESEYISIRKT